MIANGETLKMAQNLFSRFDAKHGKPRSRDQTLGISVRETARCGFIWHTFNSWLFTNPFEIANVNLHNRRPTVTCSKFKKRFYLFLPYAPPSVDVVSFQIADFFQSVHTQCVQLFLFATFDRR